MGRKDQWPQDWSESRRGQPPQRGWHGGRQRGKGQDKGKDQAWHSSWKETEEPAFPTLEAMQVTTTGGKGGQDGRAAEAAKSAGSKTMDLVSGAQRLVNNLRKAEVKVRKTDEKLARLQEQWTAYQDKLKKAFLKERDKFLDASKVLRAEQAENILNEEEALNELQEAIAGGGFKPAESVPTPTMEEEQAWDSLMQEDPEDDEMGLAELVSGALAGKRASQKATRQQVLNAIAARRAELKEAQPSTPKGRRSYVAETTPPATTRPGRGLGSGDTVEAADKDPYMTSPSTGALHLPDGAPRSKSRTSARIPVKQLGRVPSKARPTSSGLADKLEARREATRAGAPMTSEILLSDDPDEEVQTGDVDGNGAEGRDQVDMFGLAFSVRPADVSYVLAYLCEEVLLAYKTLTKVQVLAELMEAPYYEIKGLGKVDMIMHLLLMVVQILYGTALWEATSDWGVMEQVIVGWQLTCLFLQTVTLMVMLALSGATVVQGRRKRVSSSAGCNLTILLVFGTLGMAGATIEPPAEGSANRGPFRDRTGGLPRLPQPTDLELWASGQLTAREQDLRAESELIYNASLYHSEGEYAAPMLATAAPGQGAVLDHQTPEDRRAVHISVWVTTPFWGSEVVDIGIGFPITERRVCDAVRSSVRELPDYADSYLPTVPQIGGYFGSCLAIPAWTPAAGLCALVIDNRSVGGEIFSVYHRGPLTYHSLRTYLPEEDADSVDIYLFGSLAPLRRDQPPPVAVQGGVVKALYAGEPCVWEDELSQRLTDPSRWNPRVATPEDDNNEHVVYQSPEDQLVYYELPGADAHRADLAEQLMGFPSGQCWVRAPDVPAVGITHAGRYISKQIAVNPGPRRTQEDDPDATIVFLDLRGIGMFPQWVHLPGSYFNTTEYLEGIQAPTVEGWTILIEGGELTNDTEVLRVTDGETLNILLKETAELTESADEDEGTGGDNGGTDDSSDTHDPLPDSSDLTPPSAPGDGVPRGPPPPTPVNDRSRSPRRTRHTGEVLELLQHLPPPEFDIALHRLQLPCDTDGLLAMMRVWSPAWIDPVVEKVTFKPPTVKAIREAVHWSSVLDAGKQGARPELHLFSDGSWTEDKEIGGYAVVVVIVLAGLQAVMGYWGEATQGNSASLWAADTAPALHNEQVALATGLLWVLQSTAFLELGRYVLHYDCAAAGRALTGDWRPLNELGERSHYLELYLQEILPVPLEVEHVKAHNGHPYNEMADVLSKAVAGGTRLPTPPREVVQAFLQTDLTWMATGRGLTWSAEAQLPKPQLRPDQLIPVLDDGKDKTGTSTFCMTAMSLNVQSLKGKHRYIESQLTEMKCNLAMFQETKGQAGVCESRDYLRLSTDGKAHWGVAVWISKRFGLLAKDGKPYRITEDDVRVVTESPRLLVLAIDAGGRKVVIVAGHAPHGGKTEELRAFMTDLCDALQPLVNACLIVCGLDLNGRLPVDMQGVTGAKGFGDPDLNGCDFARLAQRCHLWVPATYEELHEGTDVTYRQANGAEHRIDYIALGGTAVVGCLRSWVAVDFDMMAPNEDHDPVAVSFSGNIAAGHRNRIFRPKYDGDKMLSQEGRATIHEALWNYQPPAWTVHPTDHYEHFRQYVHKVLGQHFPVQPDAPKSDYISDLAWTLRDGKNALKRRSRHRRDLWVDLRDRAFLQWARADSYAVEDLVAKQNLLYELVAGAVKFVTYRTRGQVRRDKNKFLQGLATAGGDKYQDVVRQVKRAGLGGKSARTPWRPMPALLDTQGNLADTAAAKDKVWLDHFGAQECGKLQPTVELIANDDQRIYIENDLQWKVDDIPSVLELEAAMRRAPRRKAVGLDGVPGELMAAAPAAASRALYPLVAKATLLMCQPLHWRGGILQESWKRSGARHDVANYRSLFVSSLPGKGFHRLLRERAGTPMREALHDLQLGAQKRAPVLIPALYLQAFLRGAKKAGQSVAIVFLDSQSAYYRVIRELAVGQIELESDFAVSYIFKVFGLHAEDMDAFRDMIRDGGMMADANMRPPLRHLVKDMLHRSWFVTRHGTQDHVSVTKAGSRPGSSWADVVYAFVLSRILTQIHEVATAEDLLTPLQVNAEYGPLGTSEGGIEVLARDCVWADDCAFPLSDGYAARLMRKLRRMTEIIIEFSERHGMLPNLKPKKTAAILALRGSGARRTRQEWFPSGKRTLTLPELQKEVQVAPSYVHLGGVIEPEMKLVQEARRRLGMAKSAFDSGKSLIYTNESIPLLLRTTLFHMAVTSTGFNLGLWVPVGRAWDLLEGGFTKILQGLLSKRFKGETYYKLPAPAVHILTETPPLASYARKARLSLLTAMCWTAPDLLWAALQLDDEWNATLRADLEWLRSGSDQWPDLQPASWPRWHHLLKESGSWVKRKVATKIAKEFGHFGREQLTLLALWSLYKRACERWPVLSEAVAPWMRPLVPTSSRPMADLLHTGGSQEAQYVELADGTTGPGQGWRSPGCTSVLHTLGATSHPFTCGLGSKGWRMAAERDFTLAIPEQQAEAMNHNCERRWPEEVKRAYCAACDCLTGRRVDETVTAFKRTLLEVLAEFPLYYVEVREILDEIEADVRLVVDSGNNDYWTPEGVAQLLEAVRTFSAEDWTSGVELGETPPKFETLKAFTAMVRDLNWASLLGCSGTHVTLRDASVLLDDDWEAAWDRPSEVVGNAAVRCDFWGVLPGALQKAWDLILDGHKPTVQADSTAERINVLGKPDPRCKLRHTDFVEMTAPLLSNKVLALILKDCVDCVHDKAEWGLDRVWCKLAQKLVGDVAKPCALLDAAPVAHLDWKKAVVTPDFKASELAVKSEYPEYWSDIRNIDCVNDFKDNVYVAEPVPHASANVSAPLSSEASIQPASK
ncbi:unnamed protein product [Symbiodinium sp. CCMP2592]|nr:unnamed protein product [Symbiodinium sp. CCMP2592]